MDQEDPRDRKCVKSQPLYPRMCAGLEGAVVTVLPLTLTLISSRKCIYNFRSVSSRNSSSYSALIFVADVPRFLFCPDASFKRYSDESCPTHGWFCGDRVNILPYFNAVLFCEGMEQILSSN
jgi:hypothetical protein